MVTGKIYKKESHRHLKYIMLQQHLCTLGRHKFYFNLWEIKTICKIRISMKIKLSSVFVPYDILPSSCLLQFVYISCKFLLWSNIFKGYGKCTADNQFYSLRQQRCLYMKACTQAGMHRHWMSKSETCFLPPPLHEFLTIHYIRLYT